MDKLYLVSTHTDQFELCFENDGNYYVDLDERLDMYICIYVYIYI